MSGFGKFIAPTQDASSGGSGWTPHSDWIDISEVNDNEINLLVGDFGIATIAFGVSVANNGTFSIDWGDGTVETLRASGTTYQHTYTVGTGTYCSFGYYTYKIRIYGATGNITRFRLYGASGYMNYTYAPLLWAVFGTTNLTDCSYIFSYNSTPYVYCSSLQAVYFPESLNSCTSFSNAFRSAVGLQYIRMPVSAALLTSVYQICYDCRSLSTFTYPEYMPLCNYFYNAHYGNNMLGIVNLPTKPFTSTAFDANVMFYNNCSSVLQINNLDNLGGGNAQNNLTSFATYPVMSGSQSIVYSKPLYAFHIVGYSTTYRCKVSSIRLTSTASLFAGSSPQVNISYCSLDATALNTLFGDLPTLTGKTIQVTGNPGAATCDTSIATAKGWSVTTT